jgi:hypothetical protein
MYNRNCTSPERWRGGGREERGEGVKVIVRCNFWKRRIKVKMEEEKETKKQCSNPKLFVLYPEPPAISFGSGIRIRIQIRIRILIQVKPLTSKFTINFG